MKSPKWVTITLPLLCYAMATHPCVAQPSQNSKSEIPVSHIDNLLQGKIYVRDYVGIKGSQFLTGSWQLGEVRVLDQHYTNLPLWYDIYRDELIFIYQQAPKPELVQLIKQHVESFTLGKRGFINLALSKYRQTGLKAGFYEVVYEGKFSFLIKRSLAVQSRQAVPNFVRSDQMFLINEEGEVFRIRKKKSLLKAVGEEQKKALQSFMKRSGITLQNPNKSDWSSIMQYLNGL